MSLLEEVAAKRAGGQPATVRTVRLCGTAGLVAFSMIGEKVPPCPGHSSEHSSMLQLYRDWSISLQVVKRIMKVG